MVTESVKQGGTLLLLLLLLFCVPPRLFHSSLLFAFFFPPHHLFLLFASIPPHIFSYYITHLLLPLSSRSFFFFIPIMSSPAAGGASSSAAVPLEWTSTWNLFDERHTGAVSHTDLKHILRSLGRRYTEAEFNDLLRPLPDPAPFDAFVKLMQQPYTGPTEDDLVTALRAFDVGDSGSLKLTELITLLTTLGEKMPEADVRQLLAEVPTDEKGRVRINELAMYLCTPVPTTTPDIEELRRQLDQISSSGAPTAAAAAAATAGTAAAATTTSSP